VAPKGGLQGCLFGERNGGDGGSIFGHVDGEERTLGDFGVGGVSALTTPRSCVCGVSASAAPRSCVRGLSWGQWAHAGDRERHEGFSERNLSAPAPTPTVHAGIVTLLGAPLGLPSPR
jgi:hypothetical protein